MSTSMIVGRRVLFLALPGSHPRNRQWFTLVAHASLPPFPGKAASASLSAWGRTGLV